jgi:hypothetical protein
MAKSPLLFHFGITKYIKVYILLFFRMVKVIPGPFVKNLTANFTSSKRMVLPFFIVAFPTISGICPDPAAVSALCSGSYPFASFL